jgi:hypothetical protein
MQGLLETVERFYLQVMATHAQWQWVELNNLEQVLRLVGKEPWV